MASLTALCLLLGAGCTAHRTIDRGAPAPQGSWLVVTFAEPRAVRATRTDASTTELQNVTGLRGPLVAAAGDTVTLRMDLDGSGVRVGSSVGSLLPAPELRQVTLVRDAGTSVRQLRVSLARTAVLVLGVSLAVAVVVSIAAVAASYPID